MRNHRLSSGDQRQRRKQVYHLVQLQNDAKERAIFKRLRGKEERDCNIKNIQTMLQGDVYHY